MYFSSLNYKFVFILTLFNTFLSLYIGDSGIIDNLPVNYIDEIHLNSGDNITINFDLKEKELIYFSLISYNRTNFTIDTNIDFKEQIPNTTYTFSRGINYQTIKNGSKPYINICSEKDNIIQIIHIKNTSDSLYYKVTQGDDETITIKKKFYNFVKFLGDDKTIKVDIKFKDNLKNNISYGIVRLLNKDEKYIPRVETFKEKGLIKKYDIITLKKKDETINIKKIEHEKDDENNGIYTAFILSIDSSAKIKDYSIIINEDIMNSFLLGSIIVALVFAVITFFLIRRKQNVGEKKTGEEFYEEKQEEEKET